MKSFAEVICLENDTIIEHIDCNQCILPEQGSRRNAFTGEFVIHNSDRIRQKTHCGEKLVLSEFPRNNRPGTTSMQSLLRRFLLRLSCGKSRIRTALRSEAKQRDRISLYCSIPASSAFPEEKYLS